MLSEQEPLLTFYIVSSGSPLPTASHKFIHTRFSLLDLLLWLTLHSHLEREEERRNCVLDA